MYKVVTLINCVCFHKLGPFKKDYTRYIEKQLVLTRGKITIILSPKHVFFFLAIIYVNILSY